ncbi:MAG: PIN domain-containing protein [Steroidobacteraceae bacterium]
MANTYVLIDFENVQPKSLATLRGKPVHLRVFVGSQQSKVPFDLAQTVQSLGTQAEYVQIAGTGRNALDLHIAYYIGRLATQHPDAQFHILSKDRDYDVLIKHLNETGVRCRRSGSLDDIPALKAPAPQKVAPPRPTPQRPAPQKAAPAPRAETDPLANVIVHLRNLKNSRPRKLKTLASTLKARFVKSGAEREVQALVEALQRRGVVQVSGTNVTYQLDA